MLYNPFSKKFRVSGTWRPGHAAIDYATPMGYRFAAPGDGTYRRMPSQLGRFPGQAGIWAKLELTDGRTIVFCHLGKHVVKNGAKVVKGQNIAETGNTGYVLPMPNRRNPNAGSHMHTYGLSRNGARWNWTVDTEDVATGRVSARNGLWVRTKPSAVTGRKIKLLKFGTKVTRVGSNRMWWKIEYAKGKYGYVHAGHIS